MSKLYGHTAQNPTSARDAPKTPPQLELLTMWRVLIQNQLKEVGV